MVVIDKIVIACISKTCTCTYVYSIAVFSGGNTDNVVIEFIILPNIIILPVCEYIDLYYNYIQICCSRIPTILFGEYLVI